MKINSLKRYSLMLDDLFKYQDIDKFLPLCVACPNYSKNYACPPIDFNINDLRQYDMATVIICECDLPENRNTAKAQLDNEFEKQFELVFSCGHCTRCDICKRIKGMECKDFLYSAEVLCIDMQKLYRKLTGSEMVFDGRTMIYIAFGSRTGRF